MLALLRREEGASSAELIDATGWLPHSMRAALTGLRKKGHAIECRMRGDLKVYRLVARAYPLIMLKRLPHPRRGSDGSFDLGMTQQDLDCAEIAGRLVKDPRLGLPKRMRIIVLTWLANSRDLNIYKPCMSPRAYVGSTKHSRDAASQTDDVVSIEVGDQRRYIPREAR